MTGAAVDLQGWARSWLEFVLGLDRPLSPVLVQDGEWVDLLDAEVPHRLATLGGSPDGTHAVVWRRPLQQRDALWIEAAQVSGGRVLAQVTVAQPVQVDPTTGHGVAVAAPVEIARKRTGHSATAWLAAAGIGVVVGLMAVLGLVVLTDRTGVPSGQPPAGTPTATPTVPATPAAQLQAQQAGDAATAETLIGKWVPQVSAKSVGLVVDGVTFDEQRILADFQATAARYPDAVLVRSQDFTSFRSPGFWVTLVPVTFDTADGANAWCEQERFAADDCFAKRLSRTEGPDGNSLPR
ncbi:hypothetical protein [Pseudonocardia sp.]|uniref:hypothetical protein n=1 Tax=Pseudonocardia sp. TaxID=60912 RepID=UPI003D129E60